MSRGRQALRVLAALGHDLVEDTEVGIEEVHAEFGPEVAELIAILTDTGKEAMDYFSAIAANVDAAIVKTCDRWNNVLCAHKIEDDTELRRFCNQTANFIIPIAEVVDMNAASRMRLELLQLRRRLGDVGGGEPPAYDITPHGG